MKPQSYTKSEDTDTSKLCQVLVTEASTENSSSTSLGNPFMRTFVTTLDSAGGKMTFAVNANAPDGTSTNFPVDDDSDDGLSGWAIFGIIAGCLLLIILIILLIMYCKGKGKKGDAEVSDVRNDESAHLNDTSVNQQEDSSDEEDAVRGQGKPVFTKY